MIRKAKQVIVVEGKHDIDLLSSFLDADFIKTDGTSLPIETLNMLKEVASSGRDIIVLTDPDAPGEKIRKTIQSLIPNCKHAFISPKESRKNRKVGVEHANKKTILEALENIIEFKEVQNTITIQELYELGLIGTSEAKAKRIYLEEKIHLGHGSAKTLLKRLNMLGIKKGKIEELLNSQGENKC
ncbi:MAG: ribonuclease M5 [Erysipelotrichales bacterium]|nr:ribonuclease M5 [Erysipelotrichales bacterium]